MIGRVPDYVSNERSHIDLIREDFERSRSRSVMRHNQSLVDRPLVPQSVIVPALAIAVVVALGLLILKSII